MLYEILKAFNAYLPARALEAQMTRLKQYEDQMYFAWIGKFGDKDPYYYRIHSPVTFCEFDFHCGSEYEVAEATEVHREVEMMLTLFTSPRMIPLSLSYQHTSSQVSHPHCQSLPQHRRLWKGSHSPVEVRAGSDLSGRRKMLRRPFPSVTRRSLCHIHVPFVLSLRTIACPQYCSDQQRVKVRVNVWDK